MPNAHSMPNYYAILDISPQADRAAIRRKYRELMHNKQIHPDLGGEHVDAALINEAYSVLRSPDRRAAYDRLYLTQVCVPSITKPISNQSQQSTQSQQHTSKEAERRTKLRVPYEGMLLIVEPGTPTLPAQCHNLSEHGLCIRSLRTFTTDEQIHIIFQDDPALSMPVQIRWRRIIPQRFGPPLYEAGCRISAHGSAGRYTDFFDQVRSSKTA